MRCIGHPTLGAALVSHALPPGISTNASSTLGTTYVDPPPVCRTVAPAHSAANSPTDMPWMFGIVVGDSALDKKITVPPFAQKSLRNVSVRSSTDAIARGSVLSLYPTGAAYGVHLGQSAYN